MSTGNTKLHTASGLVMTEKKTATQRELNLSMTKSDLSLDYPDSGETSEELGESEWPLQILFVCRLGTGSASQIKTTPLRYY